VVEYLRARAAPPEAEHLDEARARLERERPEPDEPFERGVARRLDELRALCELARHLRGR
jgi:hypothetical protein